MKLKYVYYAACLVGAMAFASCNEDEVDRSVSVIIDSDHVENDFDRWLYHELVLPYNIEVKYRYEDIESDMDYQLVPADYQKSVQLTHLVKFLCLEAYDEITGSKDFMRSYFPKMIVMTGSAAFQNNNSKVLGQAEGGRKITLFEVNEMDPDNIALLTKNYFHTIHHEFAHILHQTIPYDPSFDQISGSMYRGDDCFDYYQYSDALAQQDGFITAYAATEGAEDFVEIISNYVTKTADDWNGILANAGDGADIIEQKFNIVYNYMNDTWHINLNTLRDIVLRRSVEAEDLDVDDLTIPSDEKPVEIPLSNK